MQASKIGYGWKGRAGAATLALLVINSQRGIMARKQRQEADLEVFERQAIICKAFANPTRLHLLDLLGKGERSLADVQQALGISKANLSQHLAVLKSAGVITTHRDGKHVYAMLAIPEVKQACHLIREVLRGHIRQQNRHLRPAP